MHQGTTDDVRHLYESYPYPYSRGNPEPDMLLSYVFRWYFLMDPLAGWRILDAGCGTGHKLAGLARTYPKARFVGVELSGPSAEVARQLIAGLKLSNVEVRHGSLTELPLDERYDFVQSFGVIHHLEHPQKGLDRLGDVLANDGIMAIWLYHPLGEFERLTQRELLIAIWGSDWKDMAQGESLMQSLGLDLDPNQYGPSYGPRGREANALEANADAFMHPIVHAYRFGEAMQMMRLAGMQWTAVDMINMQGTVKLLNLSGVEDPFTGSFFLRAGDLFDSEKLRVRYNSMSMEKQLDIIELKMRPRGFQILAGRGESYAKLAPRIRGNVIHL